MMKGITKNGELKNVIVDDDGLLPVKFQGKNVAVTQTSDKEVTLNASILTLSTTEQSITIGKKVTMIMIANYSETADVSIIIDNTTYQVGANLALELPMNITIDSLILLSTEDNTKIQLVIKGVE